MAAADDIAPGFDIRHYLDILRRRRILLSVATLVVFALAVLMSVTQTPRYTANAEIVFTPTAASLTQSANTVSLDPARDVQTQIEVLTSGPVQQQVAEALHVPTAPHITAAAVLNANAIEIAASDTDPVRAAQVANTYANTYVTFSRNQTVSDAQAAEKTVSSQIADLQHQIDDLTSQITGAPADKLAEAQANLGPQRDQLITRQADLKAQLGQLQLQADLGNTGAQLGSPASVPSSPSSPHPVTSGISGLLLGLFLGVILAFLVDYVDDSIKSREDAERAAFGLATLGVTPPVPGWRDRQDVVVTSLSAPTSPGAEAYRSLRTTLQFMALDRSLRVVQVTSPGSSEGKTTTLANLAVAFGRGGSRVCAVDGDLRRPRLSEFFSCQSEPGLTSVASGRLPLTASLQPTDASNVTILAAGDRPENPSELLASPRIEGVLTSLASQYDIVLVDSPPVLPVTDASVIARSVDGVIVVVDAGHTKRRALTRAVETLRQVDAPVLGLIVNRGGEEAGYGYRYGYGYYGKDDATARSARSLRGARSMRGRGSGSGDSGGSGGSNGRRGRAAGRSADGTKAQTEAESEASRAGAGTTRATRAADRRSNRLPGGTTAADGPQGQRQEKAATS